MITRVLTILILFNASFAAAQQTILYGKVVNDSLQPIKHASIGFLSQPIGTVADDLGTFELKFNNETISKKIL